MKLIPRRQLTQTGHNAETETVVVGYPAKMRTVHFRPADAPATSVQVPAHGSIRVTQAIADKMVKDPSWAPYRPGLFARGLALAMKLGLLVAVLIALAVVAVVAFFVGLVAWQVGSGLVDQLGSAVNFIQDKL